MIEREYLIDVTRLVWRCWSGRLPTGIDRVCLAYLEFYGERAQAVVQRGGLQWVFPPQESDRLFAAIRAGGFKVIDLSRNEMAKLHLRYMVGGPGRGLAHERLFRFEFPERPGALLRFLEGIGPGWNISLFHYRNQGADYGRILVGLQVPAKDDKAFAKFLDTLGFPYVEETQNPVYRLFLQK